MEKILYIVRGIPGSGKSTFAKTLGGIHIEADQYFVDKIGSRIL
jgi:adenylate kinase family enzyme